MAYGKSLYGTLLFGTEGVEDTHGNEAIDLMKYLPYYWQDIREMQEIQKILGANVWLLKSVINALLDQLFISTAAWGLDFWERELGVQIDHSRTVERRREILFAKIRGAGTTTKEMIEDVAMAFSGGEVKVHEYPGEYRFVIQFVGVKGIPPNMAGLIQAIEDIKPAHLACSFKYTYTVWNMMSGVSWSKTSDKTWAELRVYEGE